MLNDDGIDMLSNEQTTKKEKVMKDFKVFIKRMMGKFFPTKEDKVWKWWVDFKDRKTEDLIELLSSNAKDDFKRRALFLLIIPSAEFNTLYWKQKIGNFNEKTSFLEELTYDQLDYVANLIIEFYPTLAPTYIGKMKYSVIVNSLTTEKYRDALYFYNHCIYHLLTILPEKKVEKIFSHFSLLDISTFQNMYNVSGYNPFSNLLYMEIDEKWKKMADGRMRAIITSEIAGKSQPRTKWEDALVQYASIIQLQLFRKVKYSLELFASQIQFVIDNSQYKTGLIDNYNIIKLFNIFNGDEYKKFRHAIAEYALLKKTESDFSDFTICDDGSQKVADQILKEFGDDTELVSKIKKLEGEKKKKDTENEIYQAKQLKTKKEKQTTENNILAQMK